jgi:hypothetical protein
MYLIRTVLSYSLLIIVAVMIGLAYQYREQVVPEVQSAWQDLRQQVLGEDHVPPQQATGGEAVTAAAPEAPSAPSMMAAGNAGEAPVPGSPAAVDGRVSPTGTEQVESAPLTAVETGPAGSEGVMIAAQPAAQTADDEAQVTGPEQHAAAAQAGEPAATVPAVPQTGVGIATAPSQQEAAAMVTPPASATITQSPPNPARVPAPVRAPVAGGQEQASAKPEPTLEAALLQQARQAYWQRDYAAAVKAYQQLLEADPENPDLYGELGNVYYGMGEWQKAGQAYYSAAQRLLARGRTQQVSYLLRVIEGLDTELAGKLRQQIDQPAS